MAELAANLSQAAVKQCCAAFYGSDYARFLLGDSFHPGGVALTHEVAERLALGPHSRVLDVASGRGASALYLAATFGCTVVGVDLSAENVLAAEAAARERGLSGRARFLLADAEALPFPDASFTAVLCECAFCTFPGKSAAAAEFRRVLEPGGSLGLTDLTKAAGTHPELDGLLAWIACIGDAQPAASYQAWLSGAGFAISDTVDRSECLRAMADGVRGRMLLAEVLVGLKKLALPDLDFAQAKHFLDAASRALTRRELGYVLLTARKPATHGAA